MDTQNPQIRRLVFWNRFWLAVIGLYALTNGFVFLVERLTYDASRLHLGWGNRATALNERVLVLSLNQGGPFVVTHLVKQPMGSQDKAVAALPKPVLVHQFKSWIDIRPSELSKMTWIAEDGKKVSAPAPGHPVTAWHYKMLEVTTKPVIKD